MEYIVYDNLQQQETFDGLTGETVSYDKIVGLGAAFCIVVSILSTVNMYAFMRNFKNVASERQRRTGSGFCKKVTVYIFYALEVS